MVEFYSGVDSRFPFSDLSYVLIFIFMCLHAFGAHYTYSEVPLGFWISDALELGRNHYDRWVHFSFGLLVAHPSFEIALRVITPVRKLASLVGFTIIVTISAAYEVIEWCVAQIADPKAALAYTGTQGDVFDAQKDMALAAAGAVLSLLVVTVVSGGIVSLLKWKTKEHG